MKDDIRAVLLEHGRLARPVETLGDDADLFQAGMTSHASVDVMLALEGRLGVEFPDRMLRRSVFQSISALASAIDELRTPSRSALT